MPVSVSCRFETGHTMTSLNLTDFRTDHSLDHSSAVSVPSVADHLDMDSIYQFESIILAVVPAVFGLIALLGLVGNLIVVIVIISHRQMHNTTNVLIVSLAFADLLFIVVCVPFTAIGYSIQTWPFGDVWCKIYQYVAQVTAYASVYTLVLMSLDRYLAVVHPIRSIGIRTHVNASILCSLTWILILACNSPVIFEFQTIEYTFIDGTTRSACLNVYIYNNDSSVASGAYYHGRLYYGCFFVFAYVLPLSLVCVLYGLMIRRLLFGVMPGAATGSSARSFVSAKTAERTRGKKRVTRLVLVVVVVFALCWLPLQLILMIQFVVLYPDQDTEHTGIVVTKIVFNCLAYMNSCVNPILYAFLSDNFRKIIRRTTGDLCPDARAASNGRSIRCGCWYRMTDCIRAPAVYRGSRTIQQGAVHIERNINGRPGDVASKSNGIAMTEFEQDGHQKG